MEGRLGWASVCEAVRQPRRGDVRPGCSSSGCGSTATDVMKGAKCESEQELKQTSKGAKTGPIRVRGGRPMLPTRPGPLNPESRVSRRPLDLSVLTTLPHHQNTITSLSLLTSHTLNIPRHSDGKQHIDSIRHHTAGDATDMACTGWALVSKLMQLPRM